MTLPSGEEDKRGVLQVERVVNSLQLAVESKEIVKRGRVLRGYAEELSTYCDPGENATAFRQCQAVAVKAIDPLLVVARDARLSAETRKDTLTEVRVAVFEALARICFDNVEAAAATADCSSLLEAAVLPTLKPAEQVQQQQEHLAALQLIQALAAAATEAPVLAALLPGVVALAASAGEAVVEEEGSRAAALEALHQRTHAAFRSVRTTALEVLVSCSLGRQRRKDIAALLPAKTVHAILADTWDDSPIRAFTVSLLFANLCDLEAPADLDAEAAPARFNELAENLWESTGFFEDLSSCLGAALEMRPWPPQSQIYHRPWKLLNTIVRLVLVGRAQQLLGAVQPLISCVLRRLPTSGSQGIVSADDARAARLASSALLGLAADPEAAGAMRQAAGLADALRCMVGEEPAAAELLEIVAGTAWQEIPSEAGADVSNASAAPF